MRRNFLWYLLGFVTLGVGVLYLYLLKGEKPHERMYVTIGGIPPMNDNSSSKECDDTLLLGEDSTPGLTTTETLIVCTLGENSEPEECFTGEKRGLDTFGEYLIKIKQNFASFSLFSRNPRKERSYTTLRDSAER